MAAYKDTCQRCGREFTNYDDLRANRQFCSVGCQAGDAQPPPSPAPSPASTPAITPQEGQVALHKYAMLRWALEEMSKEMCLNCGLGIRAKETLARVDSHDPATCVVCK